METIYLTCSAFPQLLPRNSTKLLINNLSHLREHRPASILSPSCSEPCPRNNNNDDDQSAAAAASGTGTSTPTRPHAGTPVAKTVSFGPKDKVAITKSVPCDMLSVVSSKNGSSGGGKAEKARVSLTNSPITFTKLNLVFLCFDPTEQISISRPEISTIIVSEQDKIKPVPVLKVL